MLNIDNSRSYANRDNLQTALRKYGFDVLKHIVVRNSEGNWTAIFPRSFLDANDFNDTHTPLAIAHRGFMVLG